MTTPKLSDDRTTSICRRSREIMDTLMKLVTSRMGKEKGNPEPFQEEYVALAIAFAAAKKFSFEGLSEPDVAHLEYCATALLNAIKDVEDLDN